MTHNSVLIHNAQVITPQGVRDPGWLLVENKVIAAIGSGNVPDFEPGRVELDIDAKGLVLLPGFIDLHVHGALGHEAMDASPDALREMARYYASHGVTGFLASTWTATRQVTLSAIRAVAEIAGPVPNGAKILGLHLEGPYFNPKRCGAQDINLIRRADRDEALEFLDNGPVRLVALAPEFTENLWLIDECIRRGITVSAGHTDAGLADLEIAVQHGLSQVTHCFNAMRPLGHRDLGTVGAAMSLPQINCELIADNIHVHPAAQKILIDVKRPQRVLLITDAIRGAGLPDGEYPIDNRTVTIRNGEVHLPDGTIAGSILTMERALKNVVKASGCPLDEVWIMSSLNPARAIGESARKGSLEVGKDADLVLLDADFRVAVTIVEGEIVFQKTG